ncbi:MAG: GAF domain-containing protein [Pseudomonadota bacterium]
MSVKQDSDPLSHLCHFLLSSAGCDGILVSRSIDEGQCVLAKSGQKMEYKKGQVIPTSHTICHHTASMGVPLIIDDTFAHPLVKRSKAVTEGGVGAYMGVPIDMEGQEKRVICAVNFRRKQWKDVENFLMTEAARYIRSEL